MLLVIQISIILFGIIVFAIIMKGIPKIIIKNNISSIITYIITVLIFMFLLNDINFIKEIIENSFVKILDEFILFIISSGLAVTIDTVIVAIIQKNKEKKIISNYEKKQKINEFPYYRDIVYNISPAMLLYIYNLKLKYDDQIMATILNLQLKGILNIQNGIITVIGDVKNLKKHEKVIIDYVNGKEKYKKNGIKSIFKEALLNDMEQENLIYGEDSDEFDITIFMEIVILWMIIFTLITISCIFIISELGIFMLISYGLIFLSIPIYKLISSSIIPFVRTRYGLELSAKLHGIKNYLLEFTTIKDRKPEEIKLFEEYMLYAIIFDIRGNLNKEIKNMYKNITKNLHIDNN